MIFHHLNRVPCQSAVGYSHLRRTGLPKWVITSQLQKSHVTATGLLLGWSAHLLGAEQRPCKATRREIFPLVLIHQNQIKTNKQNKTRPPPKKKNVSRSLDTLMSSFFPTSSFLCGLFGLLPMEVSLTVTRPRYAQPMPGKALPTTCHSFTESNGLFSI